MLYDTIFMKSCVPVTIKVTIKEYSVFNRIFVAPVQVVVGELPKCEVLRFILIFIILIFREIKNAKFYVDKQVGRGYAKCLL